MKANLRTKVKVVVLSVSDEGGNITFFHRWFIDKRSHYYLDPSWNSKL
jgi:hypothetical protein